MIGALDTGTPHASADRTSIHAPLLLPAIAYLLGVGLADSCPRSFDPHATWAFGASVVAAAACFALRRARLPVWPMVIVCVLLFGFARHASIRAADGFAWASQIPSQGMLVHLQGEVLTRPEVNPAEKRNPYFPQPLEQRVSFLMRARPAGDSARRTGPVLRVSVATERAEFGIGDALEVRGRMYRSSKRRNPGETDWRRVSELGGVAANVSVDDSQLISVMRRDTSLWQRLRGGALSIAAAALHGDVEPHQPDTGTQLLDAIILGQRSAIDRAWNDAFARAGAVHFLSVSGFHLGLLAASAAWIAKALLRASHRAAATTAIAVLAAYLLVAEWNAPILRAALLTLCFCGAAWMGLVPTALNWLAAAALLLAFLNPREALRPGFQLCFSQVAALLLLVPPLIRRLHGPPADTGSLALLAWRRGWRFVADACALAAVLWLLATPIVWFHFGRVQPWGALGSLVLTLPMILLLWAGFGAMLLRPVPLLGTAAGAAAAGLTDLNLALVRWFADMPNSTLLLSAPHGWWVVTLFLVIGGIRFHRELPGTARLRLTVIAIGAAAVVTWPVGTLAIQRFFERGVLSAWILDVGNGNAAIVRTGHGPPLIVDAGTIRNRDVADLLAGAADVRGASVVLSHADLDHYSGIPRLLREYGASGLISGEFLPRESAGNGQLALFAANLPRDLKPTIVSAGVTWNVGDATVEVLWPPPAAVELPDNDQSLVLRITQHGRSVLFPGDIEEFGLRAITAQHDRGEIDLQSDVLVAPHHGAVVSGATEPFLGAVAPEVVVASTARPTERLAAALDTLFGERCRLIVTSDVGAVEIRIEPQGAISVRTPYAAHKSQ